MPAVPTKANLLAAKKSLALSSNGYELLDRKRNILVREMMGLISAAESIQNEIDTTFSAAYASLQKANIVLGFIEPMAKTVPKEQTVELGFRSVMGVELPQVSIDTDKKLTIPFGLHTSDAQLDQAYLRFDEVKKLTVRLAEIENSIYRLADAIKKTQKRANALKNIVIPQFRQDIKFISESLDEKDREEFSRLKVIKAKKNS